jgi:iron complex outermembrane receptor protein
MNINKNLRRSTVLLALLSINYGFAQAATDQADTSAQSQDGAIALDSVIVTGTRQTGLKATDSAAPIQVLGADALDRSGKDDLIQSLVQNVPSFTSDGKGGDAAALTTQARLRGLSPNDTLILINGKRRHGTSNVDVSGGPFNGGASADLSLIPASAIDHIEILTDGAAAQYGSDAIAGVINIILKEKAHGGTISVDEGKYFDGTGNGGGQTANFAANLGFQPSTDSFVNISVEAKQQDRTDRSAYDNRFTSGGKYWPSGGSLSAQNSNVLSVPGYPYLNHTFGNPYVRQDLVSFNAGVDVNESAQFYGFATYAKKYADAIQNYRSPSTAFSVYPYGFSPSETHDETDYAITAGVKGKIGGGWNYNLSETYGDDKAIVGNINSINTAYLTTAYLANPIYGSSPGSFYEGYLESTQSTTNLDFNRDFAVGWSTPLNVAFGTEVRVDGYQIGAGEFASTYNGGAQAFPGFTTTDAGSHTRNSYSLYVDFAGAPVEKLKLDAALRQEHYNDFGDATVGKLTGRYDFTPAFALRGTASNGFRAPTLGEEYYSATQVSPTSATATLPANSVGASVLGFQPLKAEKSTNYSFGLVAKPAPKLTSTLDIYEINITDRILQSGSLIGSQGGVVVSSQVNAAIAANGNSLPAGLSTISAAAYSNAADTQNNGADLVLTYADDYADFGSIDWSGAANYNHVDVSNVKPAPAGITGVGGTAVQLLNKASLSYLTSAAPSYRINLGALWRKSDWTVNLRENVFGPTDYYASYDNVTWFDNHDGVKFTTDIDVTDQITKGWAVTLGAINLFNRYPDQLNGDYRAVLTSKGSQNVAQYSSYSPIGINGGYYYAKATFRF